MQERNHQCNLYTETVRENGRKEIVHGFVNLEKAFDHDPREVIWWAMKRQSVIEREVLAITEMYKNITTSM